ncbi:MAG: nucleoside/nucleotide kinase family protein [Lacisediminihabitans sp.]
MPNDTGQVHPVAGVTTMGPSAKPRGFIDVGTDLVELIDRVTAQRRPGRRLLLGISGAPGAGKSTLADNLISALGTDAIALPMDGFHIATAALPTRHHVDRRGAIDTFDVAGFLALTKRVRDDSEGVIYAPAFDRQIGEPIAGMIPILARHRVIIAEGNYLLSREAGWREVHALFDETWYLELASEIRLSRLAARHIHFGKSPEAGWAMASGSDEKNARQIAADRNTADLVIRLVSGAEVCREGP